MSKENVSKFLEDVKQDSALQDIKIGINQEKTKIDSLVKYVTIEANKRGYKFTSLEMEEELLPWLLSEQPNIPEVPQKPTKDTDNPPSMPPKKNSPKECPPENIPVDSPKNPDIVPEFTIIPDSCDLYKLQKNKGFEKVQKTVKEGKLFDLNGRIWA